jgi:hypothetical protein
MASTLTPLCLSVFDAETIQKKTIKKNIINVIVIMSELNGQIVKYEAFEITSDVSSILF